MGISKSPALLIAASVFGTIFLGFGVNAMLRPAAALEFFEMKPPTNVADLKVVEALMIVYGARDLFMGVAINAAAYLRNRTALGLILIAGSGVAFVDGWVCKQYAGTGEMNHWGYAPMLTVVGGLLLSG